MDFFEDVALLGILNKQNISNELLAQQAAEIRDALAQESAKAQYREEEAVLRRGRAAYDAARHFGEATPEQYQAIHEAEDVLRARAERHARLERETEERQRALAERSAAEHAAMWGNVGRGLLKFVVGVGLFLLVFGVILPSLGELGMGIMFALMALVGIWFVVRIFQIFAG